ncbi:MAG: hypothetical protein AAF975_06245 [Spirochaetota bacterium]
MEQRRSLFWQQDKLFWAVGLLVLAWGLGIAQLSAQEKLVYTISLYSESEREAALSLDANSNWLPVATITEDLFRRVPKPEDGVLRKWRIRADYSQFDTQKKAALEVLFEPKTGKPLVFVLPWKDRSFVSLQTDRSNWFIPYNEEQGALLDSEAKVSFRVVTEVGNEARLNISGVVLEAWDVVVTETHIASGPSLPNIGSASDDHLVELYRQDALQFALDFVKYGLNGELPKYYYSQASSVYGLEDGKAYSVYRWPPPQKDYGDVYINLFVKNYRYKIYDFNEMKEIYPEWFSGRRQWTPRQTSYLFVGDQVRVGGIDFVSDNILKFVVEYRKGRWQVIARPLDVEN